MAAISPIRPAIAPRAAMAVKAAPAPVPAAPQAPAKPSPLKELGLFAFCAAFVGGLISDNSNVRVLMAGVAIIGGIVMGADRAFNKAK